MEIYFLNMLTTISDNWLWLGPALVVCVLALIGYEVKEAFRDMLKDMD